MMVRENNHREVFAVAKETYERTELEIITFTTEDVITTSGLDEYEDDIIKG